MSGTPVTAGCRSVKSPHEIELMQIANDITAEVYKAAVEKLHEGMSEREFGSTLSKLFSEFGVGGGALVLFGEASAYPHGLVRDYTLHAGDIVLIDGGCSVEGYESDVSRTTVLGKATDKMHKVWEIVRKAQSAAVTVARPGIYITGEFGIRLEDELLITENGSRLMLPQAESLEKIFS